jgi:hypothetical protein
MSQREIVDWNLGTKNLRVEREGPIAWCIIYRPNARNALTPSRQGASLGQDTMSVSLHAL